MKKALLMTLAACFFAAGAQADFYFEQDVRMTYREKRGAPVESDVVKRKTFVADKVIAFQVDQGGVLRKEYGFDFAKNIYYEAKPSEGYYKWFDLDRLAEAFRRTAGPQRRYSRRQMVRNFSERLVEGKVNYPISSRRALFGKKSLLGTEAWLHKVKAGPGAFILNPFGWYWKARVWAAEDVPGFAEYDEARTALAAKAAFYRVKHNWISDFVTTAAAVEGFPLEIDFVAERRFGQSGARETSHEATTLVRNSSIDRDKLLYYREADKFSWNVVFSEGTDMGPEVDLRRGGNHNIGKVVPRLAILVMFLFLAYRWHYGGASAGSWASLGRLLSLRFYTLFGILVALQLLHFLTGLPYLVAPLVEFAMAFVLGLILIAWEAAAHVRKVGAKMREANLRFCPHCRARIESFYRVCPQCNQPIEEARP